MGLTHMIQTSLLATLYYENQCFPEENTASYAKVFRACCFLWENPAGYHHALVTAETEGKCH